MSKLAAIRIRGVTGIKQPIKSTMLMLNLHRKNYCVVLDSNPSIIGMLKKAKDYITYGEINEDTFRKLVEKRGEVYNNRVEDSKKKIKYNRFFEHNGKKYKRYFRLGPPKGGFERGGIKTAYTLGGALGYRGAEINKLILRML